MTVLLDVQKVRFAPVFARLIAGELLVGDLMREKLIYLGAREVRLPGGEAPGLPCLIGRPSGRRERLSAAENRQLCSPL